MLNDVIGYIRREVREVLGLDDAEVLTGSIQELKDTNNYPGVYISLVNLEKEDTLRNTSHYSRQNGNLRYQQPAVHLNLYLLFSFNLEDYGASLLRLSQVIELFQNKPAFSSENELAANPFPAALEKLIFDFHNLNFEQLNYLWSLLGGNYLPSVLYKARLVKMQRDESFEGPEITTIQVTTNLQ